MKEHPILFNAAMVNAILSGTKTQTRRIVKPQPDVVDYDTDLVMQFTSDDQRLGRLGKVINCPYGEIGDQLWVRETFGLAGDKDNHVLHYRATHYRDGKNMGWKPSIHMPRWASRIQLEITNISIEHLKSITYSDAVSEGTTYEKGYTDPRDAYKRLWESINGEGSWEVNPWVWVIEFKRI